MSERLSKTEAMMRYDIRLLPISQIKIGLRHRKDVGDLERLAKSLETGLLQPVGVSPEMDLIWGYRRLLATRDILKRDVILSRIVSVVSIAQGEFDENMMRKDFAPSERVALIETLRGFSHGGDRKSDQSRICDLDRLTTKEASARVGFCRDDYFRARAVVEAAKEDPERFAHLVERMDRTGRIDGAYRELKIAHESEKIRQEPQPLPKGPFRVAVVDPPWEFEEGYSLSRLGVTPYPTMSIGEIKALPVPEIMCPDSVLWMWATNRHLAGGEAGQILKHWGFRPISIVTWAKNSVGTGVWLRGQSEHAILSVRGKPAPPLKPESTLLHAPRPAGGHSSKPDEFYALVERSCPGSKVEIFARRPRSGWTTWGSEMWGKVGAGNTESPVRRNGTRRDAPPGARPVTQ
jgi:N6-adenosine-specific RNA methylase IME4